MTNPAPKSPWDRLAAAARQVTDDRDATVPYGFATRVAALALGSERRAISLLERFSLRAVMVACALALLSVAVNYSALTKVSTPVASSEDEITATDEAVSVVLDSSD